MSPVKQLQNLRGFAAKTKQKKVALHLVSKGQDIELFVNKKRYKAGEAFLKESALHFGDMKKAFPKTSYDGAMDFLCDLDTGEKTLVEMQVLPQDHWDQRTLAYAASVYSSQLSRGSKWKDLRTVICINILGGGANDKQHWKKTPE